MLDAGATFIREAQTEPAYRLWSIDDICPAMQKVAGEGGASIDLELWLVPEEGLSALLMKEPPGLCIGKVKISDGTIVLGVLGEAWTCEGKKEITSFGGWRNYIASKK